MTRFDEHLFGRLAILNGYLTQSQLQECLAYQRSLDPGDRRPIGELLRERGYLSDEQLYEILDIRRKKFRKMLLDSKKFVRSEKAFGRQALKGGYVDAEQLEKALLEQQRLMRLNLQLCLGDIMVSMGIMEIDQVLEVLAQQSHRILVCTECDFHFTVRSYEPHVEYRCKHCDSVLEIPRFLAAVATDGTLDEEEVDEALEVEHE